MTATRDPNDTPKGWGKWTPERRRLYREREADPLGRPEVRFVVATVRKLDALPIFDRSDRHAREEAAVLAYRRRLLAFRAVTPANPTNPAWCVAGAALFEAATLVALGQADPRRLPAARPKPGPARDEGRRWTLRAVGFLLQRPNATFTIWSTAAPAFEPWHPAELAKLRDAWRADRRLQKAYPWEASVRSLLQEILRGPRPTKIDDRCCVPGPLKLLEAVRDWPMPDATEDR
jgi:hypothetical protein